MHAVIVLGRQVDGGEFAAHKGRCALGVAAQQLHQAEAVALGLEDAAMFDLAQLADCTVGRAQNRAGGRVQGAGTVFQGAGEEIIEVLIGRRVFDLSLTHIDLVLLGEPGNQAILEPAGAAFRGAADQARQQVMGQQVLAGDKQTLFHGESLLGKRIRVRPGCRGGCPIRPRSRHRPLPAGSPGPWQSDRSGPSDGGSGSG